MPRKKTSATKQISVKAGNISHISGNINIAGGDITTHQTINDSNVAEIKKLFDDLYLAVETRSNTPAPVKEDLKAELQEIQTSFTEAVKKNEKIDESFLFRRFRNIARSAPDILDVAVATLMNPLAGLGVAVAKIAEKAKQETKQA